MERHEWNLYGYRGKLNSLPLFAFEAKEYNITKTAKALCPGCFCDNPKPKLTREKFRIICIWLPWVSGYNLKDTVNGYAGNGQVIDAIEVYYYTPDGIKPVKKAKYRVAPCGRGYYPWQYDNETKKGQDGYAGLFGQVFDRFQIVIE